MFQCLKRVVYQVSDLEKANAARPDRSNFQALSLLMKRVAKGCLTELVAEIYATEGELLTAGSKKLEPIINGYKELLHKAGRERELIFTLVAFVIYWRRILIWIRREPASLQC
ncbi:hypothetical protein Psch_03593 [Pelotomaculum schinkii]|uniref:Uncharacterized protein n=1 Tax=Pelotomaculum schinkii TaxID=78350 RepID=A0A4Y7R857_9FIRM|nr:MULTISPECIES: hypothetical protein [Pelotomaculum]TEB04831.1 hypothetical protein Psch_03593 [Pelotomaculum schinkii]TEB13980.1 hypothetical protein Psfp_03250 [Pelotomaculum sp. FP]